MRGPSPGLGNRNCATQLYCIRPMSKNISRVDPSAPPCTSAPRMLSKRAMTNWQSRRTKAGEPSRGGLNVLLMSVTGSNGTRDSEGLQITEGSRETEGHPWAILAASSQPISVAPFKSPVTTVCAHTVAASRAQGHRGLGLLAI